MESLREPFEVNALNFSLLATFIKPRSLQIRHLLPKEAERLAQSVAILELIRLEISYYGWICKVGARTLSPVTQTEEQLATSPLVLFLEAPTRAPAAEYERATGFPPILKDLVLRGHYHRVFPSLHQLIAKAIPSPGNLRHVGLRLLVDLDAQKIHMNLELPQDDIRITVQSWNQFSSN